MVQFYLMVCALALLHSAALAWDHPASALLALCAVCMSIVLLTQGGSAKLSSFFWGIWWYTLVLCATNALWIFAFCLNHTRFGVSISVLIYALSLGFTVSLIALAGACCWYLMQLSSRIFWRFAVVCSWYFLVHAYLCYAGLWFVSLDHGYPFANPLLTLTRSKAGCQVLSDCARILGVQQHQHVPMVKNNFVYLDPVRGNARHDPLFATASLVRKLAILPAGSREGRVIVSPESCFPYALNDYPELIAWLAGVLRGNDILLLGSYWHTGMQFVQALVPITRKGFGAPYLKQHRIGGFEKAPDFAAWFPPLCAWWQQQLDEWGNEAPQDAESQVTSLQFPELCVVPCLCSELFISNSCTLRQRIVREWQEHDGNVVGLVAAHDGRFLPYMRRLCHDYVQWYACTRLVPLWYVDWTCCCPLGEP